ncbi:hypothetical protein SCALM49S_09829 [Streptomyces californicus]
MGDLVGAVAGERLAAAAGPVGRVRARRDVRAEA